MSVPFEKLDPKQQRIVKHEKGPLLVLAGPGTGKTEVLTHRIAYLATQKKITPEKMLAVTFSRKAAGEMKDRLSEFPGLEKTKFNVSTLHAESLLLLNSIGSARKFLVADNEAMLLMKDAAADIGLASNAKTIDFYHKKINLSKANNITPDEVTEEPLKAFYHRYEELLDFNNAIDLDGLVLKVVRTLLSGNSSNHSHFEGHLLVDEYQDINQAEYKLIQILTANAESLFVVGDDDQSIYSWRGADPNIIRNFTKDFSNGRIEILEKSHRCPGNILSGAYAIVARDPLCIKKSICASKGDGAPIHILLSKSWIAEAFWMVDWIKKYLLESNTKPSDIVILSKALSIADFLFSQLTSAKISATFWRSGGFLTDKDVLDILAHLRLIVNNDDNLALRRCITTVTGYGIGDVAQEKLRRIAERTKSCLWEVIANAWKYQDLHRWLSQLKKFEFELKKVGNECSNLVPEQAVAVLAKRMNTANLVNVSRLREFAKLLPEKSSIKDLLTEINKNRGVDLVGGGPKPETEEEAVAIMSLHSAKGLGYKVVFILGMDEGILPDLYQDEYEQRRLCYVAMTRAKKELFLCHANMRKGPVAKGHSFYHPSRFLGEIPATCREIIINR
jgi:DNA helicase-2/ATP-dependent DNA helicase PcrA